MKRKEIIWLIGTIIFVLLVHFAIFGMNGLQTDATLDINIYDTYLVISSSHFMLLSTVLIFFGIYLVRMLRRNFKNLTANLMFMIANILMILLCVHIIKIIGSVTEIPSTTEHSPLNDGIENRTGNRFEIFSNTLFITQILLLALLSYSGFKTGVNYK